MRALSARTITKNSNEMKTAKIETSKGTMTAELYEEVTNTVQNFERLANSGFYDGLKWHRVIPGFMCQGGCNKGDGTGGPGYTINDEFVGDRQRHDRGVLSMANAGPNTNGSQFFICHSRQSTGHLDGRHTCFGRLIDGYEVLSSILQGDVINSIRVS